MACAHFAKLINLCWAAGFYFKLQLCFIFYPIFIASILVKLENISFLAFDKYPFFMTLYFVMVKSKKTKYFLFYFCTFESRVKFNLASTHIFSYSFLLRMLKCCLNCGIFKKVCEILNVKVFCFVMFSVQKCQEGTI